MSHSPFHLVVLRTATIESSLAVDQVFGLRFEQHHHGSGAVHHASTLGSVVLQPDPQRHEADTTRAGRIGFAGRDRDPPIANRTQQGGRRMTAPPDSAWRLRAVVANPDHHRVDLVAQVRSGAFERILKHRNFKPAACIAAQHRHATDALYRGVFGTWWHVMVFPV